MTAAEKIVKLKPIDEPETPDKDGEEFEPTEIESVHIKKVLNGWIITSTYDNEEEVVEVFDISGTDNGHRQAILAIMESMGIQQEIKLKD